MVKVIGVRFRTAGKIYFFDPLQFDIKRGTHVIVETARGIEFGTVVSGATEVEEDRIIQPLKPVLRIANERDMEQEAANKVKEKEAFQICLEKIRKHGLEMKLIDAEYTFDNNKVLFYFTADGRIDFRELVKDLASVFKTRIELRQIGVRDETKIVGGIGICGRALCCHSYLSDFIPVSIKMAKEQNLSLNPAKISGVCGRLMCCLKNEEETYEELNRRLPNIGDSVTTADGLKGEVQSVNVLRQLVKVIVDVGDEKEIKEYAVEQLQFKRRHGKKEKMELSKEELQELERLEEEDQQELQEGSGIEEESNQRPVGRNRQDRRGFQNNRQDNGHKHGEQGVDGEQTHAGSQRQGGKNRQNKKHPDNRNRSQEDREYQDAGNRQESRNDQNGRNRQESRNYQNGRNRQDGRNHQEGRNNQDGESRQENRNRHDNRNRQNAGERQEGRYHQNEERRQYLDNNGNQGGRNRNDYRNRYDGKSRQEGKPKTNDNQTEGE